MATAVFRTVLFPLDQSRAALDTIMTAIERAGYKAGDDILLGLDVASSEFYSDGVYNLESEGKTYDAAGFSAFLTELVDAYPIITIEDGMAQMSAKFKEMGGSVYLDADKVKESNKALS